MPLGPYPFVPSPLGEADGGGDVNLCEGGHTRCAPPSQPLPPLRLKGGTCGNECGEGARGVKEISH